MSIDAELTTLLRSMEADFALAGDRVLLFAPYKPITSKDPNFEDDAVPYRQGLYVSKSELLYSRVIQRHANKPAKLSVMIVEIKQLLEQLSPKGND